MKDTLSASPSKSNKEHLVTSEQKPIRIALVGCGRIAHSHLNALKLNPKYELIAVCDSVSEKADEVATKYAVRPYYELKKLLTQEKLDLLTLTTPSGLHPAQAILCADFGVNCLSEKPLGIDYKESLKCVEYFEKKGLGLFVVKQNRYNPTVAKVHAWIKMGLLGKLYLLESNVFWHRPQSYYDAAPWRGTRELDGGAFMNQASHYVDLMQWFGGEVLHASSELETFERNIECEDTGAALIRFKSGAIGVMAVSMLTYPENLEGSITIIGQKGTIRIGGKALNRIETLKLEDSSALDASVAELNYEPNNVYGHGHGIYYQELLRFLKDPHHPDAITGREGLKSLKLLWQIYGEKNF